VPYKIAITGHFRTGKDTFADMLAEALSPPTVKLHFADALKYEVAHMLYDYRNPAHRDRIVTSGVHQGDVPRQHCQLRR
jgi:dephospho-CoA kinase